MAAAKPKKVNYLNNRDLLKQIHISKLSYCYSESQHHCDYDIILDDAADIMSNIQQARQNRATRIDQNQYRAAMAEFTQGVKPKQKDFYTDPNSIPREDLVFRVMTFEHIPDAPHRKRVKKTVADHKEKVNFPPFKHYAINPDGTLREVLRSHWRGDLQTGEFCTTHGNISNELGKMFIKLVERYSQKGNWRGYSYNDEMRGQALLQLSSMGLQFNEAKSDKPNPFAYYTAAVTNSFTKVFNLEKSNQRIRDEIMIDNGHLPSFTRQIEHEQEMRQIRENSQDENN